MDHLRTDKSSLERKLNDAETELKSIDDSNRVSFTRQSSINATDNENSNLEQNISDNKTNFHTNNDDDNDGLSDSDSDVIEMRQTLDQLKHISFLPKSNINEQKSHPHIFEKTSNQSLIDSGHWSNTLLSTIHNNTYPLQNYQSPIAKNQFWQSQTSLITREAVLKAARDVLPPGVIDHLTSKTH